MYTYIVIDDEELIRKGTIKKISPVKEVTCIGEAKNGKEGIKLVQELRPDFLILDMQMPEMDGMALLPWFSEHYPSMPLIVISGYRDFDYIKQAISANAVEYILKPFSREDIQRCIQKVLDRFEQQEQVRSSLVISEQAKENAHYTLDIQMLRNLIMGYHSGSVSMTSKKLNYINNNLNLILMTVHFSRVMEEAAVQSWLEDTAFSDSSIYLSSAEHSGLGFLIRFLPTGMTGSVQLVTRDILRALRVWAEGQDARFAVGVSGIHSDLSTLAAIYEETARALDQRPVNAAEAGEQDAYFYYSGEKSPRPIRWDRTEEFLLQMDSGNEREVYELAKSLFEYYRAFPHCTLDEAKHHCYMLTENCRQILGSYMNMPPEHKDSGSVQNIVNHIFSLEELEEYYVRFFANLAAAIRPYTVYAVDDIIEKIQIYIRRNYQKDLTQELISSLFCINRSYLSTLFKARSGKKFVDYLSEVRIEQSKALLKDTKLKMHQIARAVGYDNEKYYFRVFKKYTGMTPEQYRKQSL